MPIQDFLDLTFNAVISSFRRFLRKVGAFVKPRALGVFNSGGRAKCTMKGLPP
jgi:hypothetical protein